MSKYIIEFSGKQDFAKALIYNLKEIITCKDCKYFSEFEDAEEPEYRECKYFSNWSVAHYMLPDDFCSCAEYKEAGK